MTSEMRVQVLRRHSSHPRQACVHPPARTRRRELCLDDVTRPRLAHSDWSKTTAGAQRFYTVKHYPWECLSDGA